MSANSFFRRLMTHRLRSAATLPIRKPSRDHLRMEALEDRTTPAGPPLIQGTNGDDTITVIARDSSYNPSLPGVPNPSLDGVQDFTVSVNGGPETLFTNQPFLLIDGLAGNDTIVVREP